MMKLMLVAGRAACIKRRAAVTPAFTKREDIFPEVFISQANSVVQKEVRHPGGGAIASPARGARDLQSLVKLGDSPGSPDQLASRSCGNVVTNHFGLIAHARAGGPEWDAASAGRWASV